MLIAPLIAYAILYKSDERKNEFRAAKADIQVKEGDKSDDELINEDYTWTADGDIYKVDKPVQIYDVRDNNDEYLRVRFVPMWYEPAV